VIAGRLAGEGRLEAKSEVILWLDWDRSFFGEWTSGNSYVLSCGTILTGLGDVDRVCLPFGPLVTEGLVGPV
jgi:hypothetical protein